MGGIMLDLLKATKQGERIVIIFPKKLAIKENQEFYYYKNKEGIISFIPK
ncbi:hypothetical protein RV15_GL003519 [Enterococcus silesiacus]|uniref:Uncharacterized protein n=1 Tax=Enterococcus silesiacus TaxID=332949 RepID=A0AA91GB38_9ENTE|nr:hypothetical protein RV15_GL003519 [Enterococcus silesiacus]